VIDAVEHVVLGAGAVGMAVVEALVRRGESACGRVESLDGIAERRVRTTRGAPVERPAVRRG
jgi:saccharopine dehydrogenase-like NADP-dependent oxidoreductase